jgi:hypothetical protein
MGMEGQLPPLKVDAQQLRKLGDRLLAAAADLPEAPPPFSVTGADAISTAIADKLPFVEGPIQDALPHLRSEASATATNVVTAAEKYASSDAQLAADHEAHRFNPRRG